MEGANSPKDLLRQAAAHIKAHEYEPARELLQPLCKAGDADAWWLISKTAPDAQQARVCLIKALRANPQHERAIRDLEALDRRESGSTKPTLDDEHAAERSASRLRLVLVVLTAVALGFIGYFIFRNVAYTITPPMVGPYYPRYEEPYGAVASPPCGVYTLFGHVVDGAGFSVQVQIRYFDQTVPVDADGNFVAHIPPEHVPKADSRQHVVGDPPVHVRLFDSSGQAMSGVVHSWFIDGCAMYIEFWHYDSRFVLGNPVYRPPAWDGSYSITTSDHLSGTEFFICDFTGFIGTAHDDNGPITSGLTLRLWNPDKPDVNPVYYAVNEFPALGGGGWAMFADPGQRYLIDIINAAGDLVGRNLVELPEKNGCDARLLEVSIVQAGRLDELPPIPK